jgi:UDP-N-acetylmuramoyl-L-alanyl-D-glutamate--2,6-diaminopimelate ligase
MSPLARLKLQIKQILPPQTMTAYHFGVALLGAVIYGNPSSGLIVIGVTGTKGKSSVVEMINAVCEANGWRTAVLDSIRVKIAENATPNTMRMSMPGRFFIQRFLSRARREGCTVAIIEMTSEGSRQFRHRGIALDALVFTNLAPEHIESHGSFEQYAEAKLELGRQLVRSRKRPRIMVANADDAAGARFLALPVEQPLPYSLTNTRHTSSDTSGTFEFAGAEVCVSLPGEFSLENALAAATACKALGVPLDAIMQGLGGLSRIPGRAERIEAGQDFIAIVDYAHTPESLKALYGAFANHRRICVLGSTGGGRDTWKRPVMGKIAAEMCDEVILTNEDPYDEEPRTIIEALHSGMKGIKEPLIVLDRREAIRTALSHARSGDAVLISGKGTDPTIQGPGGTSIPWSDAGVTKEELTKLLAQG